MLVDGPIDASRDDGAVGVLVRLALRHDSLASTVSCCSPDAFDDLGLVVLAVLKGGPIITRLEVDCLLARRTPRGGPSFEPGGSRASISASVGR